MAKPLCAQCRREVDHLSIAEDHHLQRVVFAAFCHGLVDSVELSFAEVDKAIITYGTAFMNQALE